MDTAIITTRMIDMDAISNFTMASAEALKKLGAVSLYTFAYERLPVEGVGVRFLGGNNRHTIGTNLRALLDTRSLARELSKYDVLVAVNPDVGSMPAIHLAKRYNPGLKLMWTFHGLTPIQYVSGIRDRTLMRIRKRAYIASMKRADLVQVFSGFIKKEASGWGVDPSKIVVAPLGVELETMASGDGGRIREKYGVGGRFLVLYVGRLTGFKRVDRLVKAVARLDNACLLVAGVGPEKEKLELLSRELGAGDRVWLAGRVPDNELPDCYAACDVWATASMHEGFCVPVAEAMAAGKPVIVPDVAAMPDTAGEGGIVYDAGDPDGLVGCISRLMADRELYESKSRAARETASRYSMGSALAIYTDIVNGLCEGKSYHNRFK